MNPRTNNTCCLLFDSDGTLVDSELLNCQAMSAELAFSDIHESPEELLHRYRGFRFSAVLDELQLKHEIVLDDEFNQRFRQRAARHFEGRLQPVADVAESLGQLANPMCVVSNGPEDKIALAMQITGLSKFFNENVFSAYTVGSWKPDPQLFLYAARTMGFDSSQCIVIEDSHVGIEAACRAGMRSILYNPEQHDELNSAATMIISSMAELPHALQVVQDADY